MLKWIGTISAVALAATLLEKKRAVRMTELESVAEAELRKVLLYAAPPTFLATSTVMDEDHPRRRGADRVS